MIDDYCIDQSIADWNDVGTQLLNEIMQQGSSKGAVQCLIVCGEHDADKRQFLESRNLKVTSLWYHGKIDDH